jgi:acyl carrier protein
MNHEEFLKELSEILELPDGGLKGDERLADLDGWTSIAMVGFIALADEKLGKTLSPRQFANCRTVNDLAQLAGVGA